MARRKFDTEIAVIGLGRFGSSLAITLTSHGFTVLGIDQDPQLVQDISTEIAYAAALDATDEDALREVEITAFDIVVVAIGSDFESNLMATVALKHLGMPRIICKALSNRQREILLKIGADRVVQPEQDAGRRLAEELFAPAMLERLPLGPEHGIGELFVPDWLVGKTLAQSRLRERHGITVLVIKRDDTLLVSPAGDTILRSGDLLVVLGSNQAILAVGSRT
jgi:trk system potassium uptake protein TrkA